MTKRQTDGFGKLYVPALAKGGGDYFTVQYSCHVTCRAELCCHFTTITNHNHCWWICLRLEDFLQVVKCHEHKTHKPPFTVLKQSSARKLQPVLTHWPLFHSGGSRGKLFFPYVRGLNDTDTQYCNMSSSSLLLTYKQAVSQHIQTIKQILECSSYSTICVQASFLVIKFIIYILLIKSIDMTATSHTRNAIHICPPPSKKPQWYALHTHVHTCVHSSWTSMCAHAHIPVMW